MQLGVVKCCSSLKPLWVENLVKAVLLDLMDLVDVVNSEDVVNK